MEYLILLEFATQEKAKQLRASKRKLYQALKVECLLSARQIISALHNNLVRLEWPSLFTDKELNF